MLLHQILMILLTEFLIQKRYPLIEMILYILVKNVALDEDMDYIQENVKDRAKFSTHYI